MIMMILRGDDGDDDDDDDDDQDDDAHVYTHAYQYISRESRSCNGASRNVMSEQVRRRPDVFLVT